MPAIKYFHVSAFTDKVFSGNPASVCLLTNWYKNELLQKIAAENNLNETVFILNRGANYEIKWFTNNSEIDFSGHATLAAAHVIFNELGFKFNELNFKERNGGIVRVLRVGELLTLSIPINSMAEIVMPLYLPEALGNVPKEVFFDGKNILAVFSTEDDIVNINPHFNFILLIEALGIIVTAPGKSSDFVSRYFCPSIGVNEDAVSGSSHVTLTQYWSNKLGRSELSAKQLSARGGKLICRNKGSRIEIRGKAITYMVGDILDII